MSFFDTDDIYLLIAKILLMILILITIFVIGKWVYDMKRSIVQPSSNSFGWNSVDGDTIGNMLI